MTQEVTSTGPGRTYHRPLGPLADPGPGCRARRCLLLRAGPRACHRRTAHGRRAKGASCLSRDGAHRRVRHRAVQHRLAADRPCQSLGTKWGLFRDYWVLAKLLITILATILLLVHMQPVRYMAAAAAETMLATADLRGLRIQLVADAGLALLALLVATTLSVYKPPGMTRYGRRKQHEPSTVSQP